MKYEIWKAKDNFWYWHLKAGNNEIIAAGEGYHNRTDCLNAIGSLMDTNRQTPVYDLSA